MNETRTTDSPIARIPNELLCKIFAYACARNELAFTLYAYGDSASYFPAFCINQVCQRWRNIARADPKLWAGEINVDLTVIERAYAQIGASRRFVRRFRKILSLYLRLSNPELLALTITGGDVGLLPRPNGGSGNEGLSAFTEILDHLHRVRLLSVSIPALRWIESNAPPMQDPALESVRIMGSSRTGASTRFFIQMPRLRTWKQVVDDFIPTHLPYAQLTKFVTGWIEWDTALRALVQCPALKRLDVSLYTADSNTQVFYPSTLSFPQLTSFRLCIDDPTDFAYIFGLLETPRLSKLKVSWELVSGMDAVRTDDWPEWHWPHQEFDAFLARSKCKLSTLRVVDLCLSSKDRKRIKKLLPEHAQFIVEEPAKDDNMDDEFVFDEDGKVILSELSSSGSEAEEENEGNTR
ncbi:hypothetical protein EV715DRAFT_297028 [Schizophyllum commune]